MSSSAQIIDPWGREEHRLLTGFVIIGSAILFLAVFSREVAAPPGVRLIVYALTGPWLVFGLAIILFRFLVVIDPVTRQASRVLLLHRIVIYRKTWPFEALQCITVRHKTDEGSRDASVGLRLSSGPVVWLRSFVSPPVGLSEEAASFVRNLEAITGLRYEESAG